MSNTDRQEPQTDQNFKRSGLNPSHRNFTLPCERCGRTTNRSQADMYVFGAICNRADCRRVSEGLGDEFLVKEMSISLPVESFVEGVPSCWSIEGEVSVS